MTAHSFKKLSQNEWPVSLCVYTEVQPLRVKAREDLPSPVFILSVSCVAVWETVREETLQSETNQI